MILRVKRESNFPEVPEDIRKEPGTGLFEGLAAIVLKICNTVCRLFGFPEKQSISFNKVERKLLRYDPGKEITQYTYDDVEQAIGSIKRVLDDLKRFSGHPKPEGFSDAKGLIRKRIRTLQVIVERSTEISSKDKETLKAALDKAEKRLNLAKGSQPQSKISDKKTVKSSASSSQSNSVPAKKRRQSERVAPSPISTRSPTQEVEVEEIKYIGLENTGNFCYQNAAIQFLFSIKKIRALLESDQLGQEHINRSIEQFAEDASSTISNKLNMLFATEVRIDQNLVKEKIFSHENPNKKEEIGKHVASLLESNVVEGFQIDIDNIINDTLIDFEKDANKLKETYLVLKSLYEKYKNGDGRFDDILSSRLFSLHLPNNGGEFKEQQDATELLHPLLRYSGIPITEIYTVDGKQRKEIKGMLLASPQETRSIEELLNKSFERTLDNTPDFLPVHVKRFDDRFTKNTQAIDSFFDLTGAPKTITVDVQTEEGIIRVGYQLSTVIVHRGTLRAGHYYTYTIEGGKIIKLNDREVREVRFDEEAYTTDGGKRSVNVQGDIAENGYVYCFRKVGETRASDEGVLEEKENG